MWHMRFAVLVLIVSIASIGGGTVALAAAHTFAWNDGIATAVALAGVAGGIVVGVWIAERFGVVPR